MSNTVLKHILKNGKRYYEIPGKRALYPSTTTVLSNVFVKPSLEAWQRSISVKEFHDKLVKHAPILKTQGIYNLISYQLNLK